MWHFDPNQLAGLIGDAPLDHGVRPRQSGWSTPSAPSSDAEEPLANARHEPARQEHVTLDVASDSEPQTPRDATQREDSRSIGAPVEAALPSTLSLLSSGSRKSKKSGDTLGPAVRGPQASLGSVWSRTSEESQKILVQQATSLQEEEEKELEQTYGIHPLFDNNQSIEYYVSAKGFWTAGKVRLGHVQEGGDEHRFIYNITVIRTGQQRIDVAVDRLRPPYAQDELVEVFLPKSNKWIHGSIHGRHGAAATITGYQVKFENQEAVENVPALMVRRRFVEGEEVEVFRDTMTGWETAQVGEDDQADQWPLHLSDRSPGAPGSVEATSRDRLSLNAEVADAEAEEGDEEAPPPPPIHIPHPWKMVPIRMPAARGLRGDEPMPSYQIRRKKSGQTAGQSSQHAELLAEEPTNPSQSTQLATE